jgi:cyclopropane-fatty-acyl-phospholipid synthase
MPTTQKLIDHLGNALPHVHFSAFDGCSSGPSDAKARISIDHPRALVRIARAPRGLGLARAWVTGEISIDGDLESLAGHESLLHESRLMASAVLTSLRAATALGYKEFRAAGATSIEYRGNRPGRHSISQDLAETDFHYSLSVDFYRHLLGPSMTYSSAMFEDSTVTLEQAQQHKHVTVGRKLALDGDSCVLDIGCGWGSFLLTARQDFGSRGIGVTASRVQYEAALRRFEGVDGLGLRYGDYRTVLPLPGATAAASIGMYEHVGAAKSPEFFKLVRRSLTHGARYLNQAIIRREGDTRSFRRNAFAQRFIFPNGQLMPLSTQLRDVEGAGFRVLGVENFGASYALTIQRWLHNLEANWDSCVVLEGEQRARAWRVYLLGSFQRFRDGAIDVTQVLAEAR